MEAVLTKGRGIGTKEENTGAGLKVIDLSLEGGKRAQTQTAVEYLEELKDMNMQLSETEQEYLEELEKIKLKLKESPVMKRKKELEKMIKQTKADRKTIVEYRKGAIGLIEKQGLPVQNILKKVS